MLGIVLPAVAAGSIAAPVRNVILPIRVIHKVVIVIDIYIVVTSPSAVATPSATPSRAYHHPHTERNRHAGSVVARRRVGDGRIGICRGPIHHCRFVAGDVHNVGLRLLDYNYALVFDYLRFYFLLLCGFEVPLLLCLSTHALHRFHHVGLLCQNGVSEVCRPLDVV
jgi:hypothetical protein